MINLQKMTIGQKLIGSVLAIITAGVVCMATVIYIRAGTMQTASAVEYAEVLADGYAKDIRAQFEEGMLAARTMAQIMEGFENLRAEERRAHFNSILRRVLEANPGFIGAWSVWEPDALDGLDNLHRNKEGTDASGRFIPFWNRGSGRIAVEALVGYNSAGDGDYYQIPLKTGNESIIDPYSYNIGGAETWITSFAVPIKSKGAVVGVVGIDMSINHLQSQVEKIRPYGTGVAAIFANGGTVAAHFDSSRLGRQMRESERDMTGDKVNDFADAVKNGRQYTFTVYAEQMGTDIYVLAHPFSIGRSTTPWSFAVGIPMNQVLAPVKSLLYYIVATGLAVIAIAAFAVILFSGSITRPIRRVADNLKDISEGEGDLTKRLFVKGNDEIALLSRSFNTFMEKLQAMVGQIQKNALSLEKSSSGLNSIAVNMARETEGTAINAGRVAAASHEMSTSIHAVASAMEEASTSINMVATATEQMTSTITEIAGHTEKARKISEKAVNTGQAASERMQALEQAARQISTVTETITEISEQTNLLALNATIEAARAGEAGKGFTVVAGEIKELSRQTSHATQEIRTSIEGVQALSRETINTISEVVSVIGEISEINTTIATAVEEQSVATREIAGNISQASAGAQEVNSNVSQLSTVSSDISRDISGVNEKTVNLKKEGDEVMNSSSELARLGSELSHLVVRFRV
ncbi:methyl-accepting chemotaxis protein [Desulfobotulus mexicanus]|uniref:Methyl-accepting chemotaxis protein n=1 Tax=Desulfobotulus mexicanus TaxID=2586642 RepID=A0A5Q4VJH5_9BACT|nr:methyl-accepting chemotaxis protein [Desulfobotulus mexicanus]TYT76111.1 methyl-accepting chemotaxis protein [Desulfobotulus mexicanus]